MSMSITEAKEALRRVEHALAVAVSRKRGWVPIDDLRQIRIDALHTAVDRARRDLAAAEIQTVRATGKIAFKRKAVPPRGCLKKTKTKCAR